MSFDTVLSTLMSWPADWFMIAAFVLLASIDAVRSGSAKIAALMLSFPVASVAFNALPQTALLSTIVSSFPASLAQAIVFLVILAAVFVVIHRIVGSYGSDSLSIVNALILGLAASVIIIVFWLHSAPLAALWPFSSAVQALFGEAYRFFWLLAAYVALAYVRS